MTLKQFMDRLEELKKVVGTDDIEVVIQRIDTRYEIAMPEIQNVMPPYKINGNTLWVAADDGNTEQVISIF